MARPSSTAPCRPAHARVRLGIAYTFQITSIYPRLSVFDNVALAAQRSGTDVAAATGAALARVGLDGFAARPAGTLAYGHRRLLEIARALAVRPKVLLLDEPAAGLVAEEIAALADLIRKLRSTGVTVLLIEHHIDLVVKISDRVTVLDYGAVIAEGPPSAVQRDERVIAAYLGPVHAAA